MSPVYGEPWDTLHKGTSLTVALNVVILQLAPYPAVVYSILKLIIPYPWMTSQTSSYSTKHIQFSD